MGYLVWSREGFYVFLNRNGTIQYRDKERKINIQKIDNRNLKEFQVEGKPVEWDKIFANHVSDKELISRTYRDICSPTFITSIFTTAKR